MSSGWKTVRVFISSTFQDMQSERDHLVRFVFPRLRERLVQRRIHLIDVDLRWGVTAEQDASEICREVIDECRPRFFCILGGRYGTVPEGKQLSITADEVHFAVLDELAKKSYVQFYFRHGTSTERMDPSQSGAIREVRGSDKARKLALLKREIRRTIHRPFLYRPRWIDDECRLTDLKEFGDRVEQDILATIDDEFGQIPTSHVSESAADTSAMEAFVQERSENFVLGTRSAVLNDLLNHATAVGDESCICITGAPGSGKSALLAHLAQHSFLASNPSTLLVSHFVGTSPRSTDLRHTLRRLCEKLKTNCPEISTDVPFDLDELSVAFLNILRQACDRFRVVIMIDAINQFDHTSQLGRMHWLPENLPANARIILSTVSGEAFDEVNRRTHPPREVKLPELTTGDGAAIIERFLRRYHKTFDAAQRAALLAKPDATSPLYLRAALEELRTTGSYQQINERIEKLPPTTNELFTWILHRLENDDGFRDAAGMRIGSELVCRFASLIGASRYGLNQRELVDLLCPGDPEGNVASLLQLLRPYLMFRGELLDFYHSQFRTAVEETWLATAAQRQTAHLELAQFFHSQDNLLASAEEQKSQATRAGTKSSAVNVRKIDELVYQRLKVLRAIPEAKPEFDQACDALEDLLTDLSFLETKTNAGRIFELRHDFSEVVAALPNVRPRRRILRLLEEAIRNDSQFISRHAANDPHVLFQSLWNSCWWYDCPEAASHYEFAEFEETSERLPWNQAGPKLHKLLELWKEQKEQQNPDFCWLRALRPSELIGEYRSRDLILEGHIATANSIAFSSNGARIASADNNGMVRVWDTTNGQVEACLMTHKWHFEGDCARGLAFSPDGRCLVCGATRNDEIQLWDLQVRELRHTFKIPSPYGRDCCVAFTPDGRQVAAVASNTVKYWDSVSGEELRSWILPGCPPAALSHDCTRVVYTIAGHDLAIFDLVRSEIIARLSGHTEMVQCVAFSPDETRVASASFDKTIRIWDAATGKEVARLIGHEHWVMSVAWSADGEQIVSGSSDGTARIWKLASENPLICTKEFCGEVGDAKFSPDGQVIAACGGHRVRLWDTVRPRQPIKLQEHSAPIAGLSFSSDAELLVSIARNENIARVWNILSGVRHRELEHPAHVFNAVFVSENGPIITSCRDGQIRIWSESGSLIDCLSGHTPGRDIGITVSSDGRFLASWGDQTVRVWNLATRKEQFCLNNLGVANVSFSPDGTKISAGEQVSAIRVWDTSDGKEIAVLGKLFPSEEVTCITFSRDGQRITAGVSANFVTWDLGTGEQILRRHSGEGTIRALSYDADGKRLIVAATRENRFELNDISGTTTIWDSSQGVAIHRLEGIGDVTAMSQGLDWYSVVFPLETAILNTATRAVVGWFPGSLERIHTAPNGRIWSGVSKNHLVLFRLEGSELCSQEAFAPSEGKGDNNAIDFVSPQGIHPAQIETATVSSDVIVRTVFINREAVVEMVWHNDNYASHAAVCPVCGTGARYSSGRGPTDIRIRFSEGEAKSIDRPITDIRIKCDGDCVLATGSGLYLLPNSSPEWPRERTCEYLLSIGSPIASHPSLQNIPPASEFRRYVDWPESVERSSESGRELLAQAVLRGLGESESDQAPSSLTAAFGPLGDLGECVMRGHDGAVYRAAFLPHQLGIVSAGGDGTVRVWDIATGEEVVTKEEHSSIIYGLAVSRDGQIAATASWDHSIGLWRGQNGEFWKRLEGHSDSVYSVDFSPDGRVLASASEDKTIRLWDTETGLQIGCLYGHTRGAVCVTFSPDGRFVASGGGDHSVRTWELQGAKELEPYMGHEELVTQVRYSPDGQYLSSASDDGTVHLRHQSKKTILRGHRGWILALAFSHDGRRLATGGQDKTIRLWNVQTGKEEACIRGHEEAIRSVAFSADGSVLLSAAEDATVRLWKLNH